MTEWAVGDKAALDAAVEASMAAGSALAQEAAARLQVGWGWVGGRELRCACSGWAVSSVGASIAARSALAQEAAARLQLTPALPWRPPLPRVRPGLGSRFYAFPVFHV